MRPLTKDLRLLYELGINARQSYSRIGKKIRLSQQMVSYKMKTFQESVIVQAFYPLLDYSRFVYLNFTVLFKVNYISKERFHSLITALTKQPSIVEVIECGGKHDLILIFSARNPSSFNKTMKEVLFSHSQLKNYTILTNVVRHFFPRTYFLSAEPNTKDVVIGGDRELLDIDETDKNILTSLQKNTVASSIEIASQCNITPKTMISHIKILEARKIIRGYHPLLHVQKLEFKVNKILLQYHNLTPEQEDRLTRFCIRNPHITEFSKLFGEWDAEITVETRNMRDFRNVYILIREQFQDIIQDSEDFPVFQTHKKQLLPDTFFSI